MKLFNRQKGGDESPQITREYYIPEEQVSGSRIDWKRAIPRVLALIAIVAILIFGVIWVVGALTDDDKPASTPAKSPAASTEREPASDAKKPAGATQSDSARAADEAESRSTASRASEEETASSRPAATQGQTRSATADSNGKLAESGPAETIALFIAATVIGTLGYQSLLRRRA